MGSPQQPEQRHLNWEGCYNVRDLGGLPTIDGGQTRRWAVIRADLLGRLTAQGRQALLDYGISTIIDLRGPKEVQEKPSAFTVAVDNLNIPTYLNLPLEKYYPGVSALISKASSQTEVYCIILDNYPDAVATVMRAIINARPGGVVIHCHAGNDRTGMVSALLLSLVGVPPETVATDYAASQARLGSHFPNTVATPEMMLTMLAHVDIRYGGVRRYLEQAGLSVIEMEGLKSRLYAPKGENG